MHATGRTAPRPLWYRRAPRSGGVRGSARHRARAANRRSAALFSTRCSPTSSASSRASASRSTSRSSACSPRATSSSRTSPASARRRWPRRSPARSAAPGTASSSRPTCCPSDVTGVSVWNRGTDEFEFRPGGVFANVVLADEINRASPKTQSALLEAMEERQVTVDAHTYRLPRPFMVIATQNPIELEGTYPAARGAARPLPHAHPDGLPEPRRRGRDPRDRRATGHARADDARAGRDRGRHRRRPRPRSRAVHVAPELARLHRRPRRRDSRRHPDLAARREPTRRARAPARGRARSPRASAATT